MPPPPPKKKKKKKKKKPTFFSTPNFFHTCAVKLIKKKQKTKSYEFTYIGEFIPFFLLY